jgi:hypothetical protein
MPDYQKGKIYKLVCNTTGLVYYGSTTETYLSQRLAGHRRSYAFHLNGGKTSITTSFQILKNENYTCELVEACPCESKDALVARERFYITNNTCVNNVVPKRTMAEYRNDKKEQLKIKQKEYNLKNKEQLEEARLIYVAKNSAKIKEREKRYKNEHKEQSSNTWKVYYKTNKEKLSNKWKAYYEANKDELNRKKREKSALKKQQA